MSDHERVVMMIQRRRTWLKLALASAVIAVIGFGIGLTAAPPADLPEQVVAVGESDKRVIRVADHASGRVGGHPEGRCLEERVWRAAPPVV